MHAAGPAVGIGLRAPHYAELAERKPPLAFLEVHSENFFDDGGAALAWLERFRADYSLSLHGVGLSLGSVDPLDERHVARLARLVERFEPMLVSEHLCWSSFRGRHAHDLLPMPFTREAADHLVGRIGEAQERLGREILVENVSAYVQFDASSMPEWEFVADVVRRAGCGLLLDVNNVWVNAVNHGFDPELYLRALDPAPVREIHLAGHAVTAEGLIDTHGTRVCDDVWRLYELALARVGPRPTLIEWDQDLPALDVLLEEAGRARRVAVSPSRVARAAAA